MKRNYYNIPMLIFLFLFGLSSFSFAHVIFSESFPNIGPSNTWEPLPAPYNDTVYSVLYAGSPGNGGDGYVGSVADVALDYVGIAAVWAGDSTAVDYFIECWLFCPVGLWGGSPQQPNIMARVNPSSSGLYCRIKVNLNTPANFSYQSYNGASWTIIPLYPAGFSWPVVDGWHKIKFQVAADTVWCWFDNHLLSDSDIATEGNPFTDSRLASGGELPVGAWGFGMLNYSPSGPLSGATTFVDDYVVRSDTTIDIGPSGVTLTPGETVMFAGSGGIAPYTYTSNNPAVGSIDSSSGLFSAVSTGTATITATDYFGYTATVDIFVTTTSAPIIPEANANIYRKEFVTELFD